MMPHIYRNALLAGLLLSSGCAWFSDPADKSEADKAVAAYDPKRIITCQAGNDCDRKWRAALEWIKNNSVYAVVTQSDDLIETGGPTGLDDHLGYTVTKKPSFVKPETPAAPATPDKYDIVMFTRCNNWFGCTPSQVEAKMRFAEFIAGPPPPANAPVLGVKVAPITPETAQKMNLTGIQGVAVLQVTPHSLAEKAGVAESDIIVEYDGKPVATEAALNSLVAAATPGQHSTLTIIRGRVKQKLALDF